MNEWERNRRMAEIYRQKYPPGTRLELLEMEDPYSPVPKGTRGTVFHIDDQSQIHMKWDNGSSLAIIPDKDVFRKLSEEEIETEKAGKDSVINRLAVTGMQSKDKKTQTELESNKKKEDIQI